MNVMMIRERNAALSRMLQEGTPALKVARMFRSTTAYIRKCAWANEMHLLDSFTDEQLEGLLEYKQSGLSIAEIAGLTGLSEALVDVCLGEDYQVTIRLNSKARSISEAMRLQKITSIDSVLNIVIERGGL